MIRTHRARLGAAALLVAALGVAAPTTSAVSSPSDAPNVAPRQAPLFDYTVTRTGKLRLNSAPQDFRAGLLRYEVTGKGQGGSLSIIRLDRGYSFADYRSDLKSSFSTGDMKPLKRVLNKVTFLGGVNVGGGETARGTMTLPRAGKYIAYNFGNLPKSPQPIVADGPRADRPQPDVAGTIKTLDGNRFGGTRSLPTSGELRFKNASSDSPHFLELIQVAEGTTRQDVVDYFQSGSEEPPPWYVADGISTDVVGPGKSMTLKYDLPAGTYVELCFFPDVNMGGMPHAVMGMARIITIS